MARKYTPEFKKDAIDYCESRPELDNRKKAENLNIPYSTQHRRKVATGDSEPLKGKLTQEEKEIARLRRENRDLQDALYILKRAMDIMENEE